LSLFLQDFSDSRNISRASSARGATARRSSEVQARPQEEHSIKDNQKGKKVSGCIELRLA